MQDPHSPHWRRLIESSLLSVYKGTNYSLLKHVKLAGLYLCIFIKSKYKMEIRDCRSSTVAVGVLGKLVSFFYFYLF